MEEECVFCKLWKGESSESILFENEYAYVVKDINQSIPGHMLIMPKKHAKEFLDLPQEAYKDFLEAVNKGVGLALKESGKKSYNLVSNNGVVAGQEVLHLHMHVIPREKDDKVIFTYGDTEKF